MIACPIIARRTTLPINPPIRKSIVHTASVPPRSKPLGTIQTHIFQFQTVSPSEATAINNCTSHPGYKEVSALQTIQQSPVLAQQLFYHISHVPLSSIHIVINLSLIIAVYRCRGIIQGSQKICFNVSNLGRISVQTEQHIFDMRIVQFHKPAFYQSNWFSTPAMRIILSSGIIITSIINSTSSSTSSLA